MVETPSFTIPRRPERHYPFSGGVEYEGETTFHLRPDAELSNEELTCLLRSVLEEGPYRYGDFLNLPMPLYLVKDEGTSDVFRVSVRSGEVHLHVLPNTESAGLRALYDRLAARTDTDWRVDRRTVTEPAE